MFIDSARHFSDEMAPKIFENTQKAFRQPRELRESEREGMRRKQIMTFRRKSLKPWNFKLGLWKNKISCRFGFPGQNETQTGFICYMNAKEKKRAQNLRKKKL